MSSGTFAAAEHEVVLCISKTRHKQSVTCIMRIKQAECHLSYSAVTHAECGQLHVLRGWICKCQTVLRDDCERCFYVLMEVVVQHQPPVHSCSAPAGLSVQLFYKRKLLLMFWIHHPAWQWAENSILRLCLCGVPWSAFTFFFDGLWSANTLWGGCDTNTHTQIEPGWWWWTPCRHSDELYKVVQKQPLVLWAH